ncbi:hypothetical protein D9M71_629860 [compost metagenome]
MQVANAPAKARRCPCLRNCSRNWQPWSIHRPAGTGFTRSSSTVIASWPVSMARTFACSLATAMTGAARCPGRSPPCERWASIRAGSMGRWWWPARTAWRTSRRCRTLSTPSMTNASLITCSTCPSLAARTCARCHCKVGATRCASCLNTTKRTYSSTPPTSTSLSSRCSTAPAGWSSKV